MKKLNCKILIIISGMLSLFLISMLFVFNYQDYKFEYNNIENILNRMNRSHNIGRPDKEPPEKRQNISEEMKNKIFMDSLVYTVTFDGDKVVDVIKHSDGSYDEKFIKEVALDFQKEKKDYYIGCLYFSDYSFSINKDTMIIVDNKMSKEVLYSKLLVSIIIFVLLEVLIIFVSICLTKWIIKPVEESFMKQKRFVADASHELKTPLTVIMANIDMIQVNKKNEKWINNIKSEADSMNNLICDLLELACLENGKEKKEDFKIENISRAIEKAVLPFESLMYENKIEFNYEIEQGIEYKCSIEKIKQLVSILVDNAIMHTYENGIIKVLFNKTGKGGCVLQVMNTGDGVKEEDVSKIFERFYRSDKSRNRNGRRYGLGLSIAKNIVDLHSGSITVKQNHEYTVFYVNFK